METLVLIPDIQAPQQDDRAIDVALKLIKYIKPTEICFLGDVICADPVSKYPKNQWKDARLTLMDEVEETNRVLDKFDKVTGGAKRKYFLEGNHETRILNWAIKNTMQIGEFIPLQVQSLLEMDRRGYKYIPRNGINRQPLKYDNFDIIHGKYTNKHHAFKHVSTFMKTIFYGHNHDYQVFCLTNIDGKPRMGMSCGCLCDFDQTYSDVGPCNWMHGITVVYHEKSGHFSAYFIPIINYKAIWNGKVFE